MQRRIVTDPPDLKVVIERVMEQEASLRTARRNLKGVRKKVREQEANLRTALRKS